MNRNGRIARGAALVEGVVSLALIIGGTVLAVLLLVNVGLGVYYKQKLALVSTYAAHHASKLGENNPNLQADTQAQAQAIATSMGLGTIRVTDIDFRNANFVGATVAMNGVMIGRGDILPAAINLVDTSSVPRSTDPMGYYYFQVSNGLHGWAPIYSQPVPGLPTWHYHLNVQHWGPGGLIFQSMMDRDPGGGPGPSTFR